MGHSDVAEAAVISARHPRWGERPLLLIVVREGWSPEPAGSPGQLRGQGPQMVGSGRGPVVPELLHTGTGKLAKAALRERYGGHYADQRLNEPERARMARHAYGSNPLSAAPILFKAAPQPPAVPAVEALGKPAVGRNEQVVRFLTLTLLGPQRAGTRPQADSQVRADLASCAPRAVCNADSAADGSPPSLEISSPRRRCSSASNQRSPVSFTRGDRRPHGPGPRRTDPRELSRRPAGPDGTAGSPDTGRRSASRAVRIVAAPASGEPSRAVAHPSSTIVLLDQYGTACTSASRRMAAPLLSTLAVLSPSWFKMQAKSRACARLAPWCSASASATACRFWILAWSG